MPVHRKILLTTGICFLLPFMAHATIYKTTDAQGNIIFTDDPPPGVDVEPVQLKEPTVLPAIKIENRPERLEIATPHSIKYKNLTITSPANEATIRGTGAVTLSATLQPPLHSEHQARWRLNGKLLAPPSSSLSHSLMNMSRGTYSAQIEVINAKGKVLKSAQVKFYVHRPSLLNQNRTSDSTGSFPSLSPPLAPQAPRAPQGPKAHTGQLP
ncbi:DUF4124 domain-containing protein [Endozoicomonadaceae bacterium StTr2]